MTFTIVPIIVLCILAAVPVCRGLDRRERRLAMLCFWLHLGAAFAQWWVQDVYYERVSDAFGYLIFGDEIAKMLDYDFQHIAPDIVKLALHLDTDLNFVAMNSGSGSGTMAAIAGMLEYLVGPSILSLCLLSSWVSWFGQVCFYKIAREELPPRDQMPALLGLFFVPSVVFWGSVFAKEALVMGALGLLSLSLYRILRNGKLFYTFGVVVGAIGVGAIKSYTLLPFVLAVAAFIYTHRTERLHTASWMRPFYLLFTALLSVAAVVGVGAVFPQYSSDNIAETVTKQQDAWTDIEGGSNIGRLGGEGAGVTEQLELVPMALLNSFFRPTIFEAKGAPAIGAALETSLLIVGLILLVDGRGSAFRVVTTTPLLAASLAFILIFAVAVGLTTGNLGSLSRYRVPMLPFASVVLLVLHGRRRETRRAEKSATALAPRLRRRAA